jgi:hypothetical protein ELI_0342
MRRLICKELRLTAHPTLFVFLFAGALLLVPGYPFSMVYVFGCMTPFFTLQYARETNDIFYTACLPIRKRDVVKGKFLLTAVFQLTQILLSLPFALLRAFLYADGNPVGLEANAAFYGFGLVTYALFDWIFLAQYFKTAYKVGVSFLKALPAAVLGIFFIEVLPHFPGLSAWLDSTAPAQQLRQLPILLIGMLAFALLLPLAFRQAAARFEKVDL